MKPLLVTGLLAATLAACGVAPTSPDGATNSPQAGSHLARMQSDLGLSAAQATQINAIEQAQRNKMDYLRTSSQARIKGLLTPDQAAKYDQMNQQRQRGMHRDDQQPPRGDMQQNGQWQHQDGRGSGMENRLQQELGLTPQQASEIASIQQADRAQMQALQGETQAQIRQVLTPAQAVKFDQMRPQRFGGDRFQQQRQN